MSTEATPVARGRIYRDVYAKRVDTDPVTATADLRRAELDADGLHFVSVGDRAAALSDGVFLVRIPDGIPIPDGDAFASGFHRGPEHPPYGRFRDITAGRFGDPLLGFHQRVNQIEQFLLERRFWPTDYPQEIARLGERLTMLSRLILASVLDHVGVPTEERHTATGGCSDGTGSYHLTFNHYRPTMSSVGLSSHKDDGFLTILRTTTPGLEVNRNNRWERVPVDPDHFVINFGLSMELLTARSGSPVAAIMHRVTQQGEDRCSYGHFSSSNCLPGSDDGVYQWSPTEGLTRICGSRELIDLNDYEIYAGTDVPEEEFDG